MPRKIAEEKSALEVSRLDKPGRYAVGGVLNLYMQLTKGGARSWIYRYATGAVKYSEDGKPYKERTEMGLGSYPSVSLKQARERAREQADLIFKGINPLAQKRAAEGALLAAQAKGITFDECARQYLKAKDAEFSAKSSSQWANTLRDYASPVFGRLPVAEIELGHVMKAIEPIWTEKTETAKRVRGRIESILDWATVSGYREGDNPARWKGHLEVKLPKPGKIQNVQHHKALPWQEVGEFMQKLRQREGLAVRCLEFVILTGLRSGEVRGARWEEIDFKAKTWTVPAERMKMKKPHTVPLCDDAITLLEQMPRLGELVFPGARGGVLSDVGLTKPIRAMGLDATVHGFRSTFRDWMAERTNYPHEVQEMALAHAVSNAVERAYRRGDLLEKRTRLMADWCRYINSPARAGEVVSIREGKA